MSLQDNPIIFEHNVETGKIRQIETSEDDLNRALSAEFLAERQKREKIQIEKLNARKSILEKLGLTEQEASILLG